MKTKYVLYEDDDDLPIHLKANSLKEMREKLWKLFLKEDGFCGLKLITKEEYDKLE